MKKSEFMLHAAIFDQRLLDKTCTVIVVTLLYWCQISVLSALSLDFIKYKLKRSNVDSFHHRLAYLPNRKLYPNIRCRCGLDTVFNGAFTTGVVCQQGTLTLVFAPIVETRFLEIAESLTDLFTPMYFLDFSWTKLHVFWQTGHWFFNELSCVSPFLASKSEAII